MAHATRMCAMSRSFETAVTRRRKERTRGCVTWRDSLYHNLLFYKASPSCFSTPFLRRTSARRRLVFPLRPSRRVFLAAELCGKLPLSFCVPVAESSVFATRHGRTNVVVMGVVVRHHRGSQRIERAFIYARVHARARVDAWHKTRFVDNGIWLENWFLIVRFH